MKRIIFPVKAVRILIATGDPNLYKELKVQLESYPSIRVIGKARTGVEALIRCGELTPHLILMDLKMPECDGVTGTQMIKTGFPEIRVLITGIKSDEEFLYALQGYADGYLRRPVEIKVLIGAIKNIILGLSVDNEDVYIP